VEFYRKAELFDSNRLWILKKLGWCSLQMKDYPDALKYFEGAATIVPDDLSIQARIGHCHLNLENFEDALSHYSKVRYFQPDNLKILRPIAYCHFVLGKLDQAAELYAEIVEKSETPVPYDLMNAGHVFLCQGRRKEALQYYRRSKTGNLIAGESFLAAFEEDIPFLLKNGIPEEEIPLVLDYLLFQTE